MKAAPVQYVVAVYQTQPTDPPQDQGQSASNVVGPTTEEEKEKAQEERTKTLYSQGKSAWNEHVQTLLKKQKDLGDEWQFRRSFIGRLQGINKKSQEWIDKATVRFPKGHEFEQDVDFTGVIFPSNAYFEGVHFKGEVSFGGAAFNGIASFRDARFSQNKRYKWDEHFPEDNPKKGSQTFDAGFGGAKFEGAVYFDGARFRGKTTFGGVQFERQVSFEGAEFLYYAMFGKATFGDAKFLKTVFHERVAFGVARFVGFAEFDGATFFKNASFLAASVEGSISFAGTTFHIVPDLYQTSRRPELRGSE